MFASGLMLAVVAVLVVRRFSRTAGGLMGVAAAIGVGVWGEQVYSAGGTLGFAGTPLSREIFLLFPALWLLLELFNLWRLRRRRTPPEP